MTSNELGDAPMTDPAEEPALPPKVKGPAEMPRYRVRIRFSKTGPLRFISHNDLLRLWDRMLRRTGLPIRSSEGFHQKTRLSSPLSLAVGLEAMEEIIDLEFTRPCSAEEVAELVKAEAPDGLGIVSADILSVTQARQQVTQVEYACEFASLFPKTEVEGRLLELMTSSSRIVCRQAPGKPDRHVDIRPFIDNIAATDRGLVILLHVRGGTTARPQEVLQVLGLGDPYQTGQVAITRRRVIMGTPPKPTDPSAAHGPLAV
ncbi:TIGR03936 family radical SAM-associated protein [bacterium]|nr:TIGR03936 family radical SAM-associated protein [bacterium]